MPSKHLKKSRGVGKIPLLTILFKMFSPFGIRFSFLLCFTQLPAWSDNDDGHRRMREAVSAHKKCRTINQHTVAKKTKDPRKAHSLADTPNAHCRANAKTMHQARAQTLHDTEPSSARADDEGVWPVQSDETVDGIGNFAWDVFEDER